MYKRHKIQSLLVLCVAIAAGLVFQLRYSFVAEAALTVASIELAVYVSAASTLLGSAFSRSLKKMVDSENSTKSMLGVLATYLRIAGVCSVITILISSLYLLKPDISAIQIAFPGSYLVLLKVASSIAVSLFLYNIFLMCLIMKFLITAMLNATLIQDDTPGPSQGANVSSVPRQKNKKTIKSNRRSS